MYDLARSHGLVPISAAACIGEHSFSTESTPLAVGCPNAIDLKNIISVKNSGENRLLLDH